MRPTLCVLTQSLLVLLLVGLAVLPRPARAETTLCTAITTVPTTITTEGIYCLNQDFALSLSTGAAITISANNVILDLNGHLLGNLAAGPGATAIGVEAASVLIKNMTIKNGTIRGFFKGIVVHGDGDCVEPQGDVVEDIRADRNKFRGVSVEGLGRGNIIRNNQVVSTGGSTASGLTDISGIFVSGCGNRVLNNDVIDTNATGGASSSGIRLHALPPFNLVGNNRITHADSGISMDTGDGAICRDNLTSAVTTAFSPFCTDAGGNFDAGR